MRILLVSANTESFPEPVFPIGACYVANALHLRGARVRIFDTMYCSLKELEKELAWFKPDRIGISLRNIDNAAYPCTKFYLPRYRSLLQAIRKVCSAPVILGGSAFSLFPADIIRYLGADCGITGEGENSLHLFTEPGGQDVQSAGQSDIAALKLHAPLKDIFPGIRKYRTIGVQTARGCPNRCIYCTYPLLEGKDIRMKSPESVCEEMQMFYRETGIRNFFLVDSLFNSDEHHMIQVLEQLERLKHPFRISCYLQPRVSDPGIFLLMKRSGFVTVDFGTDSGSSGMLATLNKSFSRDDIRMVSRACRKAGMDYCHSLLLGGPGETVETIRETVSLMDETAPRAVIPMTGIRIYPGTELERAARVEGLIGPGTSLLEPIFYFPEMGASRMLHAIYSLAAGRKNWFFPGKKDWGSTAGFRVLRFLYRRGPLWRTFISGGSGHAGS